VRRRVAPPHTIWVLCPNKNGDSYINQTKRFCESVASQHFHKISSFGFERKVL
jgi:hypothetical protein